MTLSVAAAIVLAAAPAALAAQQAGPPLPLAAPNTATPADVASVDAIIRALYEAVGFPPGGRQDSTRMRSLFFPGGHLVPPPSPQRPDSVAVWTVDDYLRVVNAFLDRDTTTVGMRARGFSEREASRRTESFGSLVHVFSTYESRNTARDSLPFARGINSIQLMRHNGRWWVVNVAWEQERPGLVLPREYLP
ncbi:MAG: hypothetical protein ACREMR_10655 [Gemmatimonadales bacterium]